MHAEVLFRDVKNKIAQFYPVNEATQLAYILLEDKYGIDKLSILKQASVELDITQLGKDIEELRLNKPIQYITNKVKFCGLEFKTDKRALIPRPETEELVWFIINTLKSKGITNQKFNILDIGTGTGCIAITLAKYFPNANVHALDISKGALGLARENADKHQVHVDFRITDVLASEKMPWLPPINLLISNPPYVTLQEKKLMASNVLDWEPHTALFVENNRPLLFYEKILELGKDILARKAHVFLEINEMYDKELESLMLAYSYSNIQLHKDFRDKPRFSEATYLE